MLYEVLSIHGEEGQRIERCGFVTANSKQQVQEFLNEYPNIFSKGWGFEIKEVSVLYDLIRPYKVIRECSKCMYPSDSNYCPNCGGKIVETVLNIE